MTARSTRQTEPFQTYDDAQRDARLRGACIVLDAHWRFWSTPTELTLLEVHSQMFDRLLAESITPPESIVIAPPASFGRPPKATA